MAIYTVKKGDSNEQLIKRHKKSFQNSRILQEIRGRQYRARPLTKRMVRKKALIREMFREKRKREQFYA